MRLRVRSLALPNGLGIQCCRELWCVGRRRGSDPVLLWLWCRPVATAPTGPLAWDPPYALGTALEKTKKKKYRFIWSSQNLTSIHEDAASLSGLRIPQCCELWCGSLWQLRSCVAMAVAKDGSYCSDSTSSLGTSTRLGCALKKKESKTERKSPFKNIQKFWKNFLHLCSLRITSVNKFYFIPNYNVAI